MSPRALVNIKTPHKHDVLSGRGGKTNHHDGNVKFRELVEERKMEYVHSERRDKPKVAAEIVRIIRQQNPPGRFLKQDATSNLWYDLGDHQAQKKTSQALREGAAGIRKEQEEEDMDQQDRTKLEVGKKSHLPVASPETSKADSTTAMIVRATVGAPLTSQAMMSGHTDVSSLAREHKTRGALDSGGVGFSEVDCRDQTDFPPALKPKPMKRATSHEYENTDTKRDLKNGVSVKRVALNRDNSKTSKNILTDAFLHSRDLEEHTTPNSSLPPRYPSLRRSSSDPTDVMERYRRECRTDTDETEREDSHADGAFSGENGAFNCDREVRRLSNTLEQTVLSGFIAPARQLSEEGRMRDMDVLYAELVDEASIETTS